MVEVRKVTAADVPQVAAALARSFHDDPVMTYIVPTKNQPLRMRQFFESEIKYLSMPLGDSYTTGDEVMGAALWSPPGKWKPSWSALLRSAPSFVRTIGLNMRSALNLMGVVDRKHPREPHYYLSTLGTDPHFQRSGVGSALLQPVLQRCDEEGIPAYLESSKDVNVPYYRRHGFEVTEEVTVPGGPTLWLMWREPQSTGSGGRTQSSTTR
jgi:ribosomal protein S18 acetylase RimI-like enzyme